jgi:toxin ParE1/3/4
MKPSRLRQAALDDIDRALDHYLLEAPHVLDDFQAEVLRARAHVEANPGTGSPRYGEAAGATGLRFWLLSRFPYAIFYLEHETFIDLLRVLHTASDIRQHLRS